MIPTVLSLVDSEPALGDPRAIGVARSSPDRSALITHAGSIPNDGSVQSASILFDDRLSAFCPPTRSVGP